MAKADNKFQVRTGERCKHLRPFTKHMFWGKVRKKAKELIRQQARDDQL